MKPYTRDAVEEELVTAMTTNRWDMVELLQRQLDIADHPPRRVTVVSAALWYAQHGIPVFPIQPGTKVPYPGSRGVKGATTDEGTIRQWWDWYPGCNVAIATGHKVDVIDYDGEQGHHAWTHEYGETWTGAGVHVIATVTTPRPGGLHVYIRATGEGNHAGIVPGVDYRGRGGYVLAPPSATPHGTYRFLRALHPEDL
jgi:hypothetical protein